MVITTAQSRRLLPVRHENDGLQRDEQPGRARSPGGIRRGVPQRGDAHGFLLLAAELAAPWLPDEERHRAARVLPRAGGRGARTGARAVHELRQGRCAVVRRSAAERSGDLAFAGASGRSAALAARHHHQQPRRSRGRLRHARERHHTRRPARGRRATPRTTRGAMRPAMPPGSRPSSSCASW